ncbi:SusC/RagA family TonB-linked outer membrane protein [Aestuariivivens sediminis]|uniref:SusC/RagA family TonB-linked outer membrane protein n=1 Tax=Aestuariivivens sediminis TaxID=2913557 RepID=UPI001F57D5AC|nr:TonB-dependent receptor [Aestuariivivens sediminis]
MRKKLLKRVMLWLLFLGGSLIYAQTTVTGVVSDAMGPLPGVNILVKGTTTGTQTDFDGNYTLEDIPSDAVIIYSFIGYQTQEITVNGQTTINVTLAEDAAQLDEVVVVGYGSVRKQDATGAVASIKPEDFNQGVQTSPDQLIQGRVPGVQITAASGEPGAASNIRIRGTSSIRGGNGPLIVVDGVPLDGGDVSPGTDGGQGLGKSSARNPLNFINPNDIASIDVLKDASATAIYGSRGANGVVIITTKRGKSGEPKLEFSSSISTATISNKIDLLDRDGFAAAAAAIGLGSLDEGQSVDGLDAILRTATTQNYNLGYSGASETGSYRLSLSLQDQEGIIKNSGLQKYTANVNLSEKFFDQKMKIDAKMIVSSVNDEQPALSQDVGAEGDLMISALRWNPTRSFYNTDGTYRQFNDNPRNPLAFLDYYSDNTETTRIFGNLSISYDITEELQYKFNFGVDRTSSERQLAVSRLMQAQFTRGGFANIQTINTFSKLFEHTLNYSKDLSDKIRLDAVVGYSYQAFERRGTTTRVEGFNSDNQDFYLDNLGGGTTSTLATLDSNGNYGVGNSSFFAPSSELQSFFGRANVSLNNKYLFTATLRVDGSSRFGEDNKYGYFPSGAFAWKMHEEEFIPEYFDDLKLRVGYGITGNQEFPAGSAQTQFKPDGGGGIQQVTVGNPDLKWETTSQINLGVDFGFFDNRLTGSIDYYSKTTDDLLFRVRAAQQAPNVFIWRNLSGVEVANNGFDVGLNGVIIDQKDGLTFDLGVNLSFLNNEITGVSDLFPIGISTGAVSGQGLSGQTGQLLYDNQPLYAFYLPVWTGYDSNGISQYADINGDGVDTSSGIDGPGAGDRTFVGDPNPDFTVGISANLKYKNFDLGIFMNGAYGHEIYNNTANAVFNKAALQTGNNVTPDVANSPQATGDAPKPSTFYLSSGDFLRLSNATIGYTFEPGKVSKWIDFLRVFVTGQNLFVITPYDGFDPEVNTNKEIDGVPSFGIDYSAYPRSRTFTFGFNVSF